MTKDYFISISQELKNLADSNKSLILSRFFKTGPGEYGEGDIFLGINVPQQRQIARKYQLADQRAIKRLLINRVHEYRLVGLLILVEKYQIASADEKKKIADFYRQNIKAVNNWDLVDVTAPKILGHFWFHYLSARARIKVLRQLAASTNLWERRIAMISTFYFISQGRTKETFFLAERLLADKHDLIHKAVGWMLREAGKKVSESQLKEFLDKNLTKMPRTALRYAIERLPEKERQAYLKRRT